MAFPSDYRKASIKEGQRGRSPRTAKQGQCSNFLTCRFDSLHAYDLETITGRCGEIDLPALTEQARQFLSVYDKPLKFRSTGNRFHDAVLLTKAIQKQIKDFSIELVDFDDGDHPAHRELVAYHVKDGLDTSNIYFMPIKILEHVDEQLREVLMDFFAFLFHYGMFIMPKSSYEMCYSMNWDDCEDQYDEMADEASPEYKAHTDRYLLGDLNTIFETIEEKKKAKAGCFFQLAEEVRFGMERYRESGHAYYSLPNGEQRPVSELFDVLEEGVKLHLEDSLSNYDIVPIRYDMGDESFCEEEGMSDDMVALGAIFMFSYGMDDDPVVEKTIETFNNNDSSMGLPVLVEVHKISKCNEQIHVSDYPQRWTEWYKKILSYIYE
jgi:hypothetical protein